MRQKINSTLICPKCGGLLDLKIEKKSGDRINKGDLSCDKCNANFKIIDDIVRFKPIAERGLDKKIKRVREMFLDQELNKKWAKHFSKEEFGVLKEEWRWMINKLNLKNSQIHLDWATGTGRFLRNILNLVKGEIIAIESDYATCVALRDFLKRIKKYSKTTIICGDARNMPLVDNSVDSVSTWSGLDEPKISKALDESKRVLKKDRPLVVSGLFFEDNSKSLKIALREKIEFAKKDKTQQYFKKLGFKDIDYKIFFEGKWASGKDFLPKKGDYYASYAVAGRKSD